MKQKVLIVSHDAGGAEVLSAWVAQHSEYHYFYLLSGPAISIFSSRVDVMVNHSEKELISLILKVNFVLTSTSWSSDVEKRAIQCAKENKVNVVSYLDHWIHYKERFNMRGCSILPDEIWVGDLYAEKIAKNVFPQKKIRYQQNIYFKEISERVKKYPYKKSSNGLTLLFLTQPIDLSSNFYNQGKVFTDRDIFDLLKYCINALTKKKKIHKLIVRIHPSDDPKKYQTWLQEFNDNDMVLCISHEKDLLIDCICSDWVIGSFSMAMVIALLAKRPVFSCLPDGIHHGLPYQAITSFKNYVKNQL